MPVTAAPSTVTPPAPLEAGAGPTFSPLYRQIKVLMLRSLQQTEWRPGESGAARVVVSRFAGGVRRHLAARGVVQGPDRAAPGRAPRAHVRPVRVGVRGAHDPCRR